MGKCSVGMAGGQTCLSSKRSNNVLKQTSLSDSGYPAWLGYQDERTESLSAIGQGCESA
jgi:hypothetical protein